MNDNQLTPVESRLLAYVASYQAKHGYGPAQVEMTVEFLWADTSRARQVLNALEKKGALRRYRQPNHLRDSYEILAKERRSQHER